MKYGSSTRIMNPMRDLFRKFLMFLAVVSLLCLVVNYIKLNISHGKLLEDYNHLREVYEEILLEVKFGEDCNGGGLPLYFSYITTNIDPWREYLSTLCKEI